MGEVYRAEDTKLGREVAIKVLPKGFASNPERVARFEREAKVLASLNHPNIAAIYSFEKEELVTPTTGDGTTAPAGEGGGSSPQAREGDREGPGPQAPRPAPQVVHFLVMELAEGETLAERIKRGPEPVEGAVRMAEQIAKAIEAAHEAGVVHRDLKPGNVTVDEEGQVKVLDFGLAKALAPEPISDSDLGQDLSLSPTLTQAMTGVGVLLGTAGYMSPEQARGKSVDRRSDIWAFGCVLYEMLTGRRLYRGETATDVVAAIVHGEPDLEELPAGVPDRIRELLERCLQKDPSRRLQSIGDARIALQEWLENPEKSRPVAVAGTRRLWLIPLVAVAAVALGVLGGRLFQPAAEPEPVRRLATELSESPLFAARGAAAVLSPDGRQIAFVTIREQARELHLRSLDRLDSTVLVSGEGDAGPHQPTFSPDGKWLAFFTFTEFAKVPVGGGTPIALAEAEHPRGADWGPDGRIVFAPRFRGGLSLVSAAGGEVQPLTEVDPDGPWESHRWPQWLPGGEAVLFTVVTRSGDPRLEVVEVTSGKRSVVHPRGVYGRYVATGHIIFADNAALFALPFDHMTLEAAGSPMPVLEGVETEQDDGEAQFDISDNGVLLYKPGSDELQSFDVAWADRSGETEILWDEAGIYGTPRLSPDRRRLALSILRGEDWDVWVYDIERDVATRITFAPGYDADPAWSPDGEYIAFASDREEKGMAMMRKRADGTGEAEVLIEAGRYPFPAPYAWSPNGKIVFGGPSEGVDSGPQDLWFLPVDGG